jgi:hypothetical protein
LEGQEQNPSARGDPTCDPGLALWPEEYLHGWDRSSARLFLPTLDRLDLGAPVAWRITIRGTGIGATVTGSVVAARRRGGPGAPPGLFLGLSGRGFTAAAYLERVARGQPVDFNERDPRYTVRWPVRLRGPHGAFQATTLDVSESGCAVVWPGPAPAVGEPVSLRRPTLFAPAVRASVRWARPLDGHHQVAGLQLLAEGWTSRRWRAAVKREAWRGATTG